MSEQLKIRVLQYVAKYGFTEGKYYDSPLGRIYIAEKKIMEGWKTRYFIRDPLELHLPYFRYVSGEIIFSDKSTKPDREQFVLSQGEAAQKDNARFVDILGKKEFNATA